MAEDPKDMLTRAALALRKAKARVSELEARINEPIAIVGLACRFPGANTPEEFWSRLERGEDCIREIPPERAVFGWPEAVPRWAGLLEQIDAFDPGFFGISPREATSLDPQQRLALEVAWESLERASIVPETLVGSKTGVFLGLYATDYHHRFVTRPFQQRETYDLTGNMLSMAPGRISYSLGFQGPSLTVDTACSSSLVAIHLACASLRTRESDLALAGGVNLIISEDISIGLAHSQALSSDGRCKTFDASANGFVRGEGCGIVVLERLSDAQRNGRQILAIIRGSAVNQDGKSTGLTAPNVLSQQALLREALTTAGLEPQQVSYIECHGTGTSLGDPIEVDALKAVYAGGRSKDAPLWLGAVKTNIGHLETAAGVAGLIKVVLAMQHRRLPPNLHLRHLNPRLGLEGTSLVPLRSATAWDAQVRIAGVSSFGLSGTNSHVILEEGPAAPGQVASQTSATQTPVLLSGRSEQALRDQARSLSEHVESRPELPIAAIANTLATSRTHFEHRACIVAADREQLLAALHALASGTPHAAYVDAAAKVSGKLVFVFPGQGSQWPEMAQALLEQSSVFRASIEACAAAIDAHTDWSLLAVLRGDPDAASLERVDVVQPVLFAMMVSLAALWRSFGIVPHAVIGHSQGEIAAAHVAGALSLEDAAKVVALRSKVIAKRLGAGAMAAVSLSANELEPRLTSYGDRIALAVDNGPASTAVSGDPDAIDELVAALDSDGVFARRIRVTYASHCAHIESIRQPLLDALANLSPRRTELTMISTVDGQKLDGTELDAEYWYRNLRQTVRFATATEALLASGHRFFVEVSPHPVMPVALGGILAAKLITGAVIGTLRRNDGGFARASLAVGELHCHGHLLDWKALFAPIGAGLVDLPTYPFQRQRYWVDAARLSSDAAEHRAREGGHPLTGPRFQMAGSERMSFWEQIISTDRLPWLADHRVEAAVLFPGAGFVELALAATHDVSGVEAIQLENVKFERALSLNDTPALVQVAASESGSRTWRIVIAQAVDNGWLELARTESRSYVEQAGAPSSFAEARARHPRTQSIDSLYSDFAALGLDYGAHFQGIRELRLGAPNSALARVELHESLSTTGYFAHPALLDACLQVAIIPIRTRNPDLGPFVPVSIRRLFLNRALGNGPVWCEAALDEVSDPALAGLVTTLTVWNAEGEVLARIESMKVEPLAPAASLDPLAKTLLAVEWEPFGPELPASENPGHWLLLADRFDHATPIATALQKRGATTETLHHLDPRSPDAVFSTLDAAFNRQPLRGIVCLWGLDAKPVQELDPSELDAVGAPGWSGALHLTQAVLQHRFRDPPRLVFVTHRSQAIRAGEPSQPEQALLWGMGGPLRSEHAEFRPLRIDLGDRGDDEIQSLAELALSETDEDQVALRGPERYVPRLRRAALPKPAQHRIRGADGRPYRLEVSQPGNLDSLQLVAFHTSEPGSGQVEIAIEAAGVNFRDVLLATGVIPPYTEQVQLGFECAGVVSRVGPGVDGLQPGQRVAAIAFGCFATHVHADARLVCPIPDSLSCEQAASLILVHITAFYSLAHVARLRPKQKVLIHSATGGVGLAAIEWAKHVGAELYVTAGSDEKRDWLRAQGLTHVSDSRSTRFVDDVLEWTAGKGVDVVLNSLSGDLMRAGLGVLRRGGYFVELGLRDALQNEGLDLAPFINNLSYSLVNLAEMIISDPELVRALLLQVFDHVRAGVLSPLPLRCFSLSKASDAIWEMSRGRHIGKFALTMSEPVAPRIAVLEPVGAALVSAERSYLITGGLGGLGLALAQWMSEQGAGHLVLLGRRGVTEDRQREIIAAMQARGTSLSIVTVDVANRQELQKVFADIPTSKPLAGVVHTAGVLDDGMLANLDAGSFRTVMAPKVAGAWNLHTLTRDLDLDFFVLYSSSATLIGSPGQANYAAANCFLDALAHLRRHQGLPATSLAWGVFAEVGLAAAEDNRGNRMTARGLAALSPRDGVELFARLARADQAHIAPCPFDVHQWVSYYLNAASWPFFSALLAEDGDTRAAAADHQLLDMLRAESPDKARRTLLNHVLEMLGRVVRMNSADLNPEVPFTALGVDSLMGIELRNRLESTTGLSLPSTAIWTYPTPSHLAEFIAQKLLQQEPSAAPSQAVEVEPGPTDGLEDISDDELLALGEELLA
jgi:acyl transferase domain-containing protein/acyl carrier protein